MMYARFGENMSLVRSPVTIYYLNIILCANTRSRKPCFSYIPPPPPLVVAFQRMSHHCTPQFREQTTLSMFPVILLSEGIE